MAWKYIDKVRTASGKWRYIYADAKTAVNNAVARARLHLRNATSNRNRLSVSYDDAQLGRNNGSGGSSSRSGGNGRLTVSYDEAKLGNSSGGRRTRGSGSKSGRRSGPSGQSPQRTERSKKSRFTETNYVKRGKHMVTKSRDNVRRAYEHKNRKKWEFWK